MDNRKHWIKLYWFCNWIPLLMWFLFFEGFNAGLLNLSFIDLVSIDLLLCHFDFFKMKSKAYIFHYYILSKQLEVPFKNSSKLDANNSFISDFQYVVSWPSLQVSTKHWSQGSVVILFLIFCAALVSSGAMLICWCFETFFVICISVIF